MFLVCCHPEILLLWERDVTTSPIYLVCFEKQTNQPVSGQPRTLGEKVLPNENDVFLIEP